MANIFISNKCSLVRKETKLHIPVYITLKLYHAKHIISLEMDRKKDDTPLSWTPCKYRHPAITDISLLHRKATSQAKTSYKEWYGVNSSSYRLLLNNTQLRTFHVVQN